jgi:hypothetical protein
MIYLKRYCAIVSVIHDIDYFAMPGQVGNLTLTPGSHNISVNWNKPTLNSDCITHYVIYGCTLEVEEMVAVLLQVTWSPLS